MERRDYEVGGDLPWNEVVYSLAKDIEGLVKPLFGTPEGGRNIGTNVSGDVTKYVDKVAEETAIERLKPLGINIVSEEVGLIDQGSEYTAVIDPIDGSYNFAVGIPIFAFSFALFRTEKPVYSALYEFTTGRYYEAIPGEGAYLNGSPIHVSPSEPKRAAVSFYTRGAGTGLIGRVKRVRVLGAIAVELAYLARGAIQAVVDARNYVRPTDIAAGVLLVREAGGIVTDERGKELRVHLSAEENMNVVAAADEALLKIILEELGGR
ncbi:bifunctional fructose-bisphosphatase/inositol-phosphate phosphatase [Thermococcus sp. Bubb.Bath]|uniref:bifunctional fructose-bisphosphatase/inositol-phosphate phosphatase n=1 Tax=Thermococcus sp. Bubb.Bath TaxID=1638242 RepID=UPI001438B0BB|nr:bifunctional fructose-bisphosphatase/inositol-phosphate phosphatase [Thermococcus sp. Bubb.Bath]NJF24738.1 bifunctional fructose-bisphosphatase/inositol-phosphate phosphatase [Thermococcus sp. Bubb.Bath]